MYSDLLDLDDAMDKYEWIIEYGSNYEALDAEHCVIDNAVRGCQSPLWVKRINNKLQVMGTSTIVNGMAAMISDWYNQATEQQRRDFSLNTLTDVGLAPLLSMGRQNGIANFIEKIKRI
jgi:sulfur transfer protein SufE